MKPPILTVFLMIIVFSTKAQQSPYKYKYQIDSLVTKDKAPFRFQYAAMYYSWIGEYQADLIINDHSRQPGDIPPVSPAQKKAFEKYHPVKAEQYIIEQAKKTSVVIINEAHNHPEHRLFVSRLLPQLKKLGYNFIGFEALQYDDSLVNSRKYPMQVPFNYTNEPCFGNLIREACSLDYQVFPYEAKEGADSKEREIQEADNITQVIKSHPTAKFVIYCGYDHAIEDSLANWGLAMAGRVKKLTGIDPLTVDQVQLTETSDRAFDYPYRRLIDLSYAAVFVDDQGNAFNKASERKTFDVNLYHPQTQYIHGRPVWLKDADNRYIAIVNKININFPCLAFAYKANENMQTALPVDIVELDDDREEKDMILPKGAVNVKIVNAKGQQQFIHIK